MWLRKTHAGSASGGYTWPNDGDSIEVPDDLGLELLSRLGGEFTEGQPQKSPPEQAKENRTSREVTEAPSTKR